MTNHLDIIRDILKVFWSISFAHRLLEFLDVTEESSSIVSIEGWKHIPNTTFFLIDRKDNA